uniref:FAM194 C-terminal domain-containing protein n=1 Tax=Ciona savignyi TaxID=51511 RepID=H2YLH1_CIOSA
MSETVSSVGAPFILQYKPESKSVKFDYDNIQEEQQDVVEWDTMEPDQHEYYQGLLNEAADERIKMMKGNKQSEMIDIEPHAAYGTQQERKVAKERAAERMKAREVERQKQTVPTNQTNFYAFARQLKTVNYSLSSEKCMEEGWTIRPVTPPPAEESVTELYVDESTTSMKSGKPHRQVFIEKHYDNGSLFLAVFADGSGNIWYPSGNLAISTLIH